MQTLVGMSWEAAAFRQRSSHLHTTQKEPRAPHARPPPPHTTPLFKPTGATTHIHDSRSINQISRHNVQHLLNCCNGRGSSFLVKFIARARLTLGTLA